MAKRNLYRESGAGEDEVLKTLSTGTRQLTVKGIQEETVQLTREAARKQGLKVSAWVRVQLREAAEKALAQEKHGLMLDSTILSRISEQLEKINEQQKRESQEISNLKHELNGIIRAQHGMMARFLASE